MILASSIYARISILCAVLFILTGCNSEGLSIGNLTHKGEVVYFKLANDSGNRGDVVFWIEQNDLTNCERVISVQPRSNYNLSIYCPSIREGLFYVRGMWAYAARDRALVAERISVQ